MVMQPPFVTSQTFEEARAATGRKKNLPALEKVRFEVFEEGRSVQILHTGPYSEEKQNLQKLYRHIEERGGKQSGKHS